MNENYLLKKLNEFYREALAGNPAPMLVLSRSLEGMEVLGMLPDLVYDHCCYLIQCLIDQALWDFESEVIPFG